MRLLIVTQKVDQNDDVLGFFHSWLMEFSKRCDSLTVICLGQGSHSLPSHVRIFSLGKEHGASRMTYVWRFFLYIWRERAEYDAVFVHMNQVYVVLGGLWWRMMKKKIGMWYVHRQTSVSLWIAEKLADFIFTATKESFNIPSTKVHILGHGIDVESFRNPGTPSAVMEEEQICRIVTVGRVTRIKNLYIYIEAARFLRDRELQHGSGPRYMWSIIGAPVTPDDVEYKNELDALIAVHGLEGRVKFLGAVPYKQVREVYWHSDLSVNLTPTGGLDKVVLESMAAHVPCLVSNRAYASFLEPLDPDLVFAYRDAEDLARKIERVSAPEHIRVLGDQVLASVKEQFGLETCIRRIIHLYG